MHALENAPKDNADGISWPLAGCFLVGDLAGAGMMALPVALVHAGAPFGMCVSLVGAVCAALGDTLLGQNLIIMRRRWPEYLSHTGRPYQEMAKRALGPRGESVLQCVLYSSCAGALIVYILLAASNVATFVSGAVGLHVHKCAALIAIGVLLWPLCMPSRPLDFGWVAIASTASSCVAVGIIIWGTAHDLPHCAPFADYSSPTSPATMSLAFGTIMFAYNGHEAFSTIQMDMKRPGDFWKSVCFTYTVLFFFMFTPISLLGYYVYGNSMVDTIIPSLQVPWMRQLVSVMMMVHVVTSYVIVFSPLAQGTEQHFRVPAAFSSRRFLVRSALLWFTVFVALTVPRFGVILDLVGGLFGSLLAVICPGVFYLCLRAGERKTEEKPEDDRALGCLDVYKYNYKADLLVVCSSVAVACVGGASATITAATQLFGADMETPCYVQFFLPSIQSTAATLVACCGVGRNISVWPDVDITQYCAIRK